MIPNGKQWSVEICSVSVSEKSKKMRIQRRDLNKQRAQTMIF